MDTGIFKKINFRQNKYMIPAFLYLPIAFIGGSVVDFIWGDNASAKEKPAYEQQYLQSGVPEANVDTTLGDKMDNADAVFGKNMDMSAIGDISDDKDSVNKKLDYESQYNDREAAIVNQQQQEEAELAEQKKREQEQNRQLREMQDRVRNSGNRRSAGRSSSDDGFVDPYSDNAIARAQRIRRQQELDQINDDLAANPYRRSNGNTFNQRNAAGTGMMASDGMSTSANGYNEGNGNSYGGGSGNAGYNSQSGSRSTSANGADDATAADDPKTVVKKTRNMSSYFNTVGRDKRKSGLISAIIDENIKAVDGSRVRLRLLDDIQIEGITVKKGTYLYAKMSGFGQQRVQGTIESIFYDEEIIPVSLTIYDTDGLQGLYVPESQFKETAKSVGSQAMSGGSNILDNSYSGSGIRGWASQAAQSATQGVMNAVGKIIKKNRVKLKYGTKVYLVDGSEKKRSENKRNREASERQQRQSSNDNRQFNPYMNYGQYGDDDNE